MGKCIIDNCELESFESRNKCVLHCKKDEYQKDKHQFGLLESFFKELIESAINSIFSYQDQIPLTKVQIRAYLNGTSKENYKNETTQEFLSKQTINFTEIYFPQRDSRDYFDYKNILDKLGEIAFNFCEFKCDGLELNNSKVFFDECIFHSHWYLYNHRIIESDRNVTYQLCKFHENVSTVVEDYQEPSFNYPIFSDCSFNKDLILIGVEFKSVLFKNTDYKSLSAKKVEITNCTFNAKTVLNNYLIEEFKCVGTEFNGKFEFKNNIVNSFLIDNVNFHNLVDCHKTEFKKCKIHRSIFDDFVGFEECIFGDHSSTTMSKAEFIYATFMSFTNFRNASFPNGLDLKRINHKETLNFLDVSVSLNGSNRETFRIIKDSFDKVGNFIEANEYYLMEMEIYKKELKANKKYSSLFLVNLYKLTSNYGQSYLRPILIIFITAVIYWVLTLGHEHNTIYSFFPNTKKFLISVASGFNGFAKSIMPFTKVLREGMEFISLIFYITFSSMIWLVILAIKRSTKR